MQLNKQSDINCSDNIQNCKPKGDEDISLQDHYSNIIGSNDLSYAKNKHSPSKNNIDEERENQIVNGLIGEGGQEQSSNEDKKKIFRIERQYLLPLFSMSGEYKQPAIPHLPQQSAATEQTQNKQDNSQNIPSQLRNQSPINPVNNYDEMAGMSQLKDIFKNNLQKNQQNLITLHPFQDNTQNSDKKSESNQIEEENEQQSIKKTGQQIQIISPQVQPFNNEEYIPTNGITTQAQQYTSPNQEIVDQMCERDLTDIKIVGSIYMMLICLLTQFGQINIAQSLYFRFQKEIMIVENGEQMFEVDLFAYIESNLSSVIYLNELIVLSLRVFEFIPLLNLFLIVFQIRIHKVRKQIISAMVKKSLSTLEILIGNYKKRIPQRKSKRQMGNQKIKRAMDLITIQYMKKGSIENEHDLLLYVINEGFQQISVELLLFYIYTKLIPPDLFITKKVVKQSLIELNIPIFAKAFSLRSKWVKAVFLTEKFFLHICQLSRCNETFAEGLYFMKKISQKKQRSSAPLWYTENVIEIFEEVNFIFFLPYSNCETYRFLFKY